MSRIWDDGAGHSEVRVWIGGPELVGAVCGVRANQVRCVLHIVDYVLLVVRVIEQVERLSPESQLVALSQMEDSRDAEIKIFEGRAAEGIELLAGNDREVHLRVVEDCGVGAAAGQRSRCR